MKKYDESAYQVCYLGVYLSRTLEIFLLPILSWGVGLSGVPEWHRCGAGRARV